MDKTTYPTSGNDSANVNDKNAVKDQGTNKEGSQSSEPTKQPNDKVEHPQDVR